MTYPHVLERLAFVKPKPNRPLAWRAACPLHEKDKPGGGKRSLSLWIVHNPPKPGALILRCAAGCDTHLILKELGLAMHDLYPDRAGPRPRPKICKVTYFEYEDDQLRTAYRVARALLADGGKTFWQERWEDRRWQKGLRPNQELFLYRLRGLKESLEPIFIVEGEPKVQALEGLRFTATCNVGGTGMGWRDSYSQVLAGKHVIILPDNDEAGRRHADRVLGNLIRHHAASVRLLELPGLVEKGDVVDWLALGHGRDDLIKLVQACPRWACLRG